MAKDYEIGGLHVQMTEAAAARWNANSTTRHDLRSSRVYIPEPTNSYRDISLARATNRRLEPDVSDQLADMPANRIS